MGQKKGIHGTLRSPHFLHEYNVLEVATVKRESACEYVAQNHVLLNRHGK